MLKYRKSINPWKELEYATCIFMHEQWIHESNFVFDKLLCLSAKKKKYANATNS